MTRTYKAACWILFGIFVCTAAVCSLFLMLVLADIFWGIGWEYPWWALPILLIAVCAPVLLGRLTLRIKSRI